MKQALFIILFILFACNIHAQQSRDAKGFTPAIHKGNATLSVGYGTPSIVRAFLRKETNEEDLKIEGFGPLCAKVDYMLFKNFSIGVNAFYNYTDASWLVDGRDENMMWTRVRSGVRVNEFSMNFKVNYHYFVREKIDMYAGAGIGYGSIKAETYAETPYPAYFLKHSFPNPLSLEATTGMRYFLHPNIGLYGELGIGRSWLLYEKYFLPEAVIQGGIFVKF